MEKPKMWNISKTAKRRAKRMTSWDPGCYRSFDARFLEFGLGSFGALCNPILHFVKTPLLCQLSSDSSKLYTMYHNHKALNYFLFIQT